MFAGTSPTATPSFDLRRLLANDQPFPPLHTDRTYALADWVGRGDLAATTNVLLLHVNGVPLVFPTLHLVFHHIAEGEIDGSPWMLSFCAACNAGMGFIPTVRGRALHFIEGGLYNAMTVLRDRETGSYWHHITGECLHGELRGERLALIETARHITAGQASSEYPNARLIYAELSPEVQRAVEPWDVFRTRPDHPYLNELTTSLDLEDARLPRLDMGLGVWTRTTRRYYPFSQLHQHNNALLDRLDGRGLLVYVDDESGNPNAQFTDAGRVAQRGSDLVLETGEIIRSGITYKSGAALVPERPQQLFIRWYAFASMFHGCEIYGR
jgi:hypothetical protein